MNLFAIIINSEMHYFVDENNTRKNQALDEYISTYRIPKNQDSAKIVKKLASDVFQHFKITLTPIKLIDIYRPQQE